MYMKAITSIKKQVHVYGKSVECHASVRCTTPLHRPATEGKKYPGIIYNDLFPPPHVQVILHYCDDNIMRCAIDKRGKNYC